MTRTTNSIDTGHANAGRANPSSIVPVHEGQIQAVPNFYTRSAPKVHFHLLGVVVVQGIFFKESETSHGGKEPTHT